MMVAPFDFYEVKISILVLILIHKLIFTLKSRTLGLSSPVFFWFCGIICFGLFFTFWSLLFPYSTINGVLKILPVYVLWPFVYLLIIPYLMDERVFILINNTMVYGALFISIYLILSFLSIIGLVPIPFDKFTLVKPILGRSESSEVQMFMPAVTSLLFLNPFLLSNLLFGITKKNHLGKLWIFMAFLLSTIAIFISGRRSLVLNILISPIVLFVFIKLSRVELSKQERKMILKVMLILLISGSVLLSMLSFLELIDFNSVWEFFVEGFDLRSSGNDESSSLRGDQLHLLTQSWKDYPVFGSGLASHSQYIVRSEDMPWMYELSFMAWLFQTGIIGLLIFLSLLMWVFIKSIMIIKNNSNRSFLIPFLVGSLCFLVGCTSNPYLQAFDHLWAIYLPVGMLNYYLLKT